MNEQDALICIPLQHANKHPHRETMKGQYLHKRANLAAVKDYIDQIKVLALYIRIDMLPK